MPSTRRPRKASLQFWPRKRANKFLPSVNWKCISEKHSKGLKGFIVYKAGMASAEVKDLTPDSMTPNKKIIIPVTILSCPNLKIFSFRFYKNGKVAKELLAENLDKRLKSKVRLPKTKKGNLESIKFEDYDDVKIIAYSHINPSGIKKTPDISEIGLSGTMEDKIKFVKEHSNKEIPITNVFEKGQLVDIRGVTKGKGFQGPVKRFGIQLRQHKSEKGVRRVGSIAPWTPSKVTFRTPMAVQMGFQTRVAYNNKIISIGENKLKNIKNFGELRGNSLILLGSVHGPAKRQLIITAPLRETKKQNKKHYELLELR